MKTDDLKFQKRIGKLDSFPSASRKSNEQMPWSEQQSTYFETIALLYIKSIGQ